MSLDRRTLSTGASFETITNNRPPSRRQTGETAGGQIGENGDMGLVVYSADWCRDCREAKRFLTKHSIAYQEIDIESTPGAADEVIRQTGKRAIPQFVLDGKWIQPYRPGRGFLHAEMAELFGVSNE
jgi:mycoredoxin